MHSLGDEIKGFSKNRLKKQCTRVTTLSGKRIIETWKDSLVHVVDDPDQQDGPACGYVQDLSMDLQIGVIKPWLLLEMPQMFTLCNAKFEIRGKKICSGKALLHTLHGSRWLRALDGGPGSQDVAQDQDMLKKYKVTHILNVAYGVENVFPDEFTYKKLSILDLPETDITSYFPECFDFIEEARLQNGAVLVHCNAGVSRAPAIIIAYLIHSEKLNFARAFSIVKNARPSVCPNPGFMEQLHKYQDCSRRQTDVIHEKTD